MSGQAIAKPTRRIVGFLDYKAVSEARAAAAAYDAVELGRLRAELRKDLDTLRRLNALLGRLEQSARPAEGSQALGSIEWKTINGRGPYAYLRRWSGSRHQSLYLGKDPHRKLEELGYTGEDAERLLSPNKTISP